MSSLLVLIPLSIAFLLLALGLFFWAVKRGQFDDLDTPAWRVLLDDDQAPPPQKKQPGEENDAA